MPSTPGNAQSFAYQGDGEILLVEGGRLCEVVRWATLPT